MHFIKNADGLLTAKKSKKPAPEATRPRETLKPEPALTPYTAAREPTPASPPDERVRG